MYIQLAQFVTNVLSAKHIKYIAGASVFLSIFWVLLPYPFLPDTIVKILLFLLSNFNDLLYCNIFLHYLLHCNIFICPFFSHQCTKVFSMSCLPQYSPKPSLLFIYSYKNAFLNIIPYFFQREDPKLPYQTSCPT